MSGPTPLIPIRAIATLAVLLAVILLSACTTSESLTDAEKSILITEANFADYDIEQRDAIGIFQKTVYFDRSVEYEYESHPDSTEIYLYCTVAIERSASDALTSEWAMKAGTGIGFKSQGVVEVPVKLNQPFGTRASLALLKKDDDPIGNIFHAVVGKKILTLIITGLYFDNEESFREFMGDYAERLAGFEVGKPSTGT